MIPHGRNPMKCGALARVDAPFPIYAGDVSPLLPQTWTEEVLVLASRYGFRSELDGGSTTSRESAFGERITSTLNVVDGEIIESALPWLWDLYHGPLLDLGNQLGLGSFSPSAATVSAININIQSAGERYEWHVDSNPLTGLLFVSTLAPEEGGQLIFRSDPMGRARNDKWEVKIQPSAGMFYMYDARGAAHTVEPVQRLQSRLSIPMNYYLSEGGPPRPTDLDGYLYGKRMMPGDQSEGSLTTG